MTRFVYDVETFDCIAYVGEVLSPFFLLDPGRPEMQSSLLAIASLDVNATSRIWPFVSAGDIEGSLALMKKDLSRGGDYDNLSGEYRCLFVGPNRLQAPPWGSVYTDRECVIFGESTLKLVDWMRAHGIRHRAEQQNPCDHIGVMLSLMSWTARHRPELMDEYLREHLFTWSSHYLKQLEDITGRDFYKGLARLTHFSLEGIRSHLEIQVDYPKYYR